MESVVVGTKMNIQTGPWKTIEKRVDIDDQGPTLVWPLENELVFEENSPISQGTACPMVSKKDM